MLTPPRVPELFVPVLKALESLGGSASINEIDDRVAALMGVSDEARSALHNDGPRTKFSYRNAWARSWLKNARFLQNSDRGVWSLTSEGRSALARDPAVVVRSVRRANSDLRKARAITNDSEEVSEAEVESGDALDWRERLLDSLLAMEPSAFERLCQRVLRESGFTKVEVTGRSGDGGIDGTGVLRVNLLSFQVLFQCKRWRGSVGASAVRDFRGSMVGRTDKGLLITTGTFSADARREATRDGAPPIELVDGDALCDLLKDRGIGVRVKMVEEINVDEGAFKSF